MSTPTDRASVSIMEILTELPSPRHAAAAVAVVRATLWLQGGADNIQRVAQMMSDDDKAALEMFATIQAAMTTTDGESK